MKTAPQPAGSPDRSTVILQATVRVIAAEGLECVTHRRVAEEAGVSLGLTTYYFASRDDLIREAFRYYAAQTLATLAAAGREHSARTAAELVDLLVEVARREFLAPEMVRVEYELILRGARDPVLAQDVAGYERELASRLAETLERLGASHPFDAARSTLALFRGFELERLTRPDADLENLRGRLLVVLTALTAAPVGTARRSASTSGRKSAGSSLVNARRVSRKPGRKRPA